MVKCELCGKEVEDEYCYNCDKCGKLICPNCMVEDFPFYGVLCDRCYAKFEDMARKWLSKKAKEVQK